MIISFILGLSLTGLLIIFSYYTGNWQVCFILSAVIAVISIVILSMIRSYSLIIGGKNKKKTNFQRDIEDKDVKKVVEIMTAFALPSIITSIVLFVKLYR